MMKAFLNDPELKTTMLESMREHVAADRLVKGSYGEGRHADQFRGCFIGCAVESVNQAKGKSLSVKDHANFEPELGIPEWIARLIDTIFEGLPQDEAMEWPVRFLEAVPVGADLGSVKKPFLLWLMDRNRTLVDELDISEDLKKQVLAAIDGVVDAIQNDTDADADAAAAAARATDAAADAAAYAARAARAAARAADAHAAAYAAYAARAARATAHAADARAARAARAAAYAARAARATAHAADARWYVPVADKLVELIAAAR